MRLVQAKSTNFNPSGCNVYIDIKLTEEVFRKLKAAGLHELEWQTKADIVCGDRYDFTIFGNLPRVDMGVLEVISRTTGQPVIVDFERDEIMIYDGYIE